MIFRETRRFAMHVLLGRRRNPHSKIRKQTRLKFGLEERHWHLLETLLITPLKAEGAVVWIFGSRAVGNHRPYSDIDILYHAPQALPPSRIGELAERIEESGLPFKIDLVDEAQLAEGYRDNVLKQRILV